jgi:hypothetical protein
MPVVDAEPAARRPVRGAGLAAQGLDGGAGPAVRPVAGRRLGSAEVGKEGERMGWRQEAGNCAEWIGCRHVD